MESKQTGIDIDQAAEQIKAELEKDGITVPPPEKKYGNRRGNLFYLDIPNHLKRIKGKWRVKR